MGKDGAVRQPKQSRGIQMKAKILATAERLFVDRGFFATTTNEIAKAADVSIGSLYSYFADKDAILTALLKQNHQYFMSVFDEMQSEANTLLRQDDLRGWLDWLIRRLVRLHEGKKGLLRELNVLRYARPDVAAVLDAGSERVRLALLDDLEKHYPTAGASDIEAVAVVLRASVSAIVDQVVFADSPVSDERIIATGVDMLYNCLN
ncbi:MAG: TetR/AcrR family transcriptional regulator [Propionibacteriaceae bacterium]|jgi:AcrR family transcriptional regulator|nr:TetR/AcrR family transcriptional regulator [Propionibacteriaceae bacterium]